MNQLGGAWVRTLETTSRIVFTTSSVHGPTGQLRWWIVYRGSRGLVHNPVN
jgi:hypothetical protein